MPSRSSKHVMALLLVSTLFVLAKGGSSPSFQLVSHPKKCLTQNSFSFPQFTLNKTGILRKLRYADGSLQNVRLPYAGWASARILAEIFYILLTEVMEYSVSVFDNSASNSGIAVNYVAGCLDPADDSCAARNLTNPLLHFTVETWSFGIERTRTLPRDLQPTLLTVMEYDTVDQIFIWSDVYDAGARQNIFLDYYEFYDPRSYRAYEYFDTLDALLKLLPLQYVETCSQLDSRSYGNDRRKAKYIEFTQNNEVDCMDDIVWLSPACRQMANISKCIPLIVQYEYFVVFQLSYFLNFPVALIKVRDGKVEFDQVYYHTIKSGRFMFGWYKPDDNLLGLSDRHPVLLKCPDTNALEQSQSLFRTSLPNVKPRNYCWRYMASTDGHVAFLGSRFNFYTQDMDQMMVKSAVARERGDDYYDAMWNVACDWVQTNMDTWKEWIPAICPAGMFPDPTLSVCLPCPAGSYCIGGTEVSQLCPVDSFCPANSSKPTKCRAGYMTDGQGHQQESDCIVCSGDKIEVNGRCSQLGPLLSAILVPIFALILIALLVAKCVIRSSASAEDKKLAKMVSSLRSRLHITRKHGYLLSTERASWWADKGRRVLIGRQSMESAARLGMMKKEFDQGFFESFCFSLLRIPGSESSRCLFSLQYISLCDWILELCQQLLAYNFGASSLQQEASSSFTGTIHGQDGERPGRGSVSVLLTDKDQENRYHFFKEKMSSLSIWRDDCAMFAKLQSLFTEMSRQLREFSDEQCKIILQEPGGESLRNFGCTTNHAVEMKNVPR
eukprot:764898-Hanusia_phi.AAC.11